MNTQILPVVEALANEKSVEKEVIFLAVEAALAVSTAKRFPGDVTVRVTVDRVTGEYSTFRYWTVVEEVENPDAEYTLEQATEIQPGIALGGTIDEAMDSIAFGRIAAQTAKQVIYQKVREAERARIVTQYEERVGELVNGIVKDVNYRGAIIELAPNVEAIILREQMIPRETIRKNDRVRGYLYDVHFEPRGPQIFVSRTCPELLIELFKIEVPEIGEQIIEVKGAARDPGSRAKIAVKTNDGRIDPIGACVGMRGSRVQAVSGELNGERVDIVLWDDNPAQLAINTIAPAEASSIVVDEESRSMDIIVEEGQLSQAIGRSGQNIRLATSLTGWTLNVMSEGAAESKTEEESKKLMALFTDDLDVDEEVAQVLIDEGFTSIEEVAYVPDEDMEEIDGFDEDIIKALRARAQDIMLTQAIAKEEQKSGDQPAEDLLTMEGMDEALAFQLASQKIITMEDLAECAVDDLTDVEGLTEERAATLIMKAREPWFIESE